MDLMKNTFLLIWVLGSTARGATLIPIDPVSVRANFVIPLSSSSSADATWIEIRACEAPEKCERVIDRIRVPDLKGQGTATLRFGKLGRVRLVQQLSEEVEHPLAESEFVERWYRRSELCRSTGGESLCQYTVYRNDENKTISLKIWGEQK